MSTALKEKALALYQGRACPHCGAKLTLWEVLAMAFGSAIRYSVRVIMPDGGERWLPAEKVNPQIMRVVE